MGNPQYFDDFNYTDGVRILPHNDSVYMFSMRLMVLFPGYVLQKKGTLYATLDLVGLRKSGDKDPKSVELSNKFARLKKHSTL